MKLRALDFLVCPRCHESLSIETRSVQGAEVLEGILGCLACNRSYPIARGVPRFVGDGAYASSFGRQWNWFRTVQLDSSNRSVQSEEALRATTGWGDEDYVGRLVLDAGVGAGRFAEVVAKKGGEVVGIDLTSAVDAAYQNLGNRQHVHLVQADIFALPFRVGTFDLAYSIGVLHHTPDTVGAFERVAATVKKGGGFAVYLYARYGSWYRGSDVLRKLLTTRLPTSVMLALSAIAIPAYFFYRLPLVGKVCQQLAPISMHPDWRWRWLDTFDWYTPQYQWKHLYPEVYGWFRENGFLDIELFDEPIRMRGTKTA